MPHAAPATLRLALLALLASAAVLIVAAPTASAAVRLTAGPKAYVDSQKQRWTPAGSRLDGRRVTTARKLSPLLGSPDLYTTVAVGARRARIPVSKPGRYAVTLYTVDPGRSGTRRVFDMLSVGTRGGKRVALPRRRVTVFGGTKDETVPIHAAAEIVVPGRVLELRFRPVRGDVAISAIEVQRLGGVDTAPLREAWADGFDGAAGAPPDVARWHTVTGDGWGDIAGPQLQAFTPRPENVSLNGQGQLVIAARKDRTLPDGSPGYTSARIDTFQEFDLTRARVSVTMKTPPGRGLWSTFWTYFDRPTEPTSGEIDVAEMIGREQGVLHGFVHGMVPGPYPWRYNNGAVHKQKAALSDATHTYSVNTEPGLVEFYLDGRQYGSVARADLPATAPWIITPALKHRLILSLTLGGWGGPVADDTPMPALLTVDRVSVWR